MSSATVVTTALIVNFIVSRHPPMERKRSIAATTLSSTGKVGTSSRTQLSEAVTSQMGDTMTVVSMAQTDVPLSKAKSVVDDDGAMGVPDLPRQRKL